MDRNLLRPFVLPGVRELVGVDNYLPAKLGMDPGESVVFMVLPGDYSGGLLFFFENGKAARVELSAYQTQTRRKKLTGAYSDKSPLVTAIHLKEPSRERKTWTG